MITPNQPHRVLRIRYFHRVFGGIQVTFCCMVLFFQILPMLLIAQNSRQTEARFLRYETGDYEHALFLDRDGQEISFWIAAEPLAGSIMDSINQNTDKWLKLTYEIVNQYIPEADMEMELELLTLVTPLEEPVNNLIWEQESTLDNGKRITVKLLGSSMPGMEHIYHVHTIEFISDFLNQTITGIKAETMIYEDYQGFHFEDMNFDGYPDFRIQEFTGTVNTPWLYYLYDNEENQFKHAVQLNELSNPEFDPVQKRITTTWRGSAVTYGDALYKMEGNQPVKLTETEYEYTEEGQYVYQKGELIQGKWTSYSGQGWENTRYIDVTGDTIEEILHLDYRTLGETYLGQLTITTSEGRDLWNHQWVMGREDLEEGLLEEEGTITVREWVNRFFSGSLLYGASIHPKKLTAENLHPDILSDSAQQLQVTAQELRNQILSRPTNHTFTYRATWREDLVELVYLPQWNRFVRYGAGEY